MFVGLCSVFCSARKIRMCPTALYFSCGALPFPHGLGGWGWVFFPVGLWKAGAGVRFLVGATSDLPVPSERQALAPEIWDVRPCCSLDSGAQHQQRLVPWQQLLISLSVIRCFFHGISVKGQQMLLLYWLCRVLQQTLPRVCLSVCLMAPLALFHLSAFHCCFWKEEGKVPTLPLGSSLFPPKWLVLSRVADCPLPAGQDQWRFMECCGPSSRVDLLQAALDSSESVNHQLFRSFKVPKWIWYLSPLCCFGEVCRHSKCLHNLWLY